MAAIFRKMHIWMARESPDDLIYNVFANFIFAIASILMASLVAPEILPILFGRKLAYQAAIWSILIIVIGVTIYTIFLIYKLITQRNMLSAKYKLAMSILLIPIVIFTHKLINPKDRIR